MKLHTPAEDRVYYYYFAGPCPLVLLLWKSPVMKPFLKVLFHNISTLYYLNFVTFEIINCYYYVLLSISNFLL